MGGNAKVAVNVPMGDTSAMQITAYHTAFGCFMDAVHDDGPRRARRTRLDRPLRKRRRRHDRPSGADLHPGCSPDRRDDRHRPDPGAAVVQWGRVHPLGSRPVLQQQRTELRPEPAGHRLRSHERDSHRGRLRRGHRRALLLRPELRVRADGGVLRDHLDRQRTGRSDGGRPLVRLRGEPQPGLQRSVRRSPRTRNSGRPRLRPPTTARRAWFPASRRATACRRC